MKKIIDFIENNSMVIRLQMSEKLKKELHSVLATELLKRVKDPDCKSSDLNVARQFLRDNNIDAVPVQDSPLQKLMEELPFDEKTKTTRQKLKKKRNFYI